MADTLRRLELHADSGRPRPLDNPKPQLAVWDSCISGYVVLALEEPARLLVIERAKLIEALKDI